MTSVRVAPAQEISSPEGIVWDSITAVAIVWQWQISDRCTLKVDFMKLTRIGLSIAAAVAAVMVPWPVLDQEVVHESVPGKEAASEKTAEKEAEQPGEEDAGSKAARKRADSDWGFRWDGRPSLHLGEGTRVDFRVRLQSDVWHSDATLSPDDDSDGDNDLNADVARRRIGIEGEILNIFDYQVERELTDNRDPWRDVYLNYKQFGFAEVMAGNSRCRSASTKTRAPRTWISSTARASQTSSRRAATLA